VDVPWILVIGMPIAAALGAMVRGESWKRAASASMLGLALGAALIALFGPFALQALEAAGVDISLEAVLAALIVFVVVLTGALIVRSIRAPKGPVYKKNPWDLT
jgi:hypothetical protein